MSCCDTIFNNRATKPRTEYAGYWRRYPNADMKYKPHFMLTLGLDCDGEEGLHRVEVLAILEAMRGRFAEPRLEDHVVLPVSEKSFAREDLK